VVDVGRELGVRIGIVERLAEEDLVDGLWGRLDASRTCEIFSERLPDEVSQGHPPCLCSFGSTPVEVGRKQELGSMHV
jgi:hypothetical protein